LAVCRCAQGRVHFPEQAVHLLVFGAHDEGGAAAHAGPGLEGGEQHVFLPCAKWRRMAALKAVEVALAPGPIIHGHGVLGGREQIVAGVVVVAQIIRRWCSFLSG
jgi:hypothetical protein